MRKINHEIEALRAIAVAITCLGHVVLLFRWNPQPLGRTTDFLQFWGGVDLFFCISGFVVSKSFLAALDRARETGNHWQTIKAFWLRRAYRLLPSAWLWVAVGFACSVWFNRTGIFGTPEGAVRSSMAVLAVSANFSRYFGINNHPNGVYWSLSLEEQFYLALPFFLLATSAKWRIRLLLAGIAVQFPLMRHTLVDLTWLTRLDALMWGILICLFTERAQYRVFEPTSLASRPVAIVTSCALLAALMTIPGLLDPLPYHVGLMAAVSAALVFAASFNKGYVLPIPGLTPFLSWMGSRSYAIYLCHLPAFMMTHEAWTRWTAMKGMPAPDGTFTLRYTVTAIALVGLFAELNYRFVEMPFRRKGARIASVIASQHRRSPEAATS